MKYSVKLSERRGLQLNILGQLQSLKAEEGREEIYPPIQSSGSNRTLQPNQSYCELEHHDKLAVEHKRCHADNHLQTYKQIIFSYGKKCWLNQPLWQAILKCIKAFHT